jgi:pyruvate dehydrogenase E2 component (dihydrolipoamide acetyltransferase)
MAQERINVPNIGDARDVDVVEVLVKPGARVEREQALIVLESDKASMDVPAPRAGVVREISIKVGDKVSEGTPILTLEIDEAGDTAASPAGGTAAEPKQKAPEQDTKAKAPSNAKPATSDKSDKQDAEAGGSAAADDTHDAPPPSAARDRDEADEADRQGQPVVLRTVPPAPPVVPSLSPPSGRERLPYASPAVRQMARELGADLTRVEGSARGGRITKEDVQRFVKQALNAPNQGAFSLAQSDAPEIDFSQFGEISLVPLTKIQRLTGKNLHRSWVTIPHVTQFDSADITELETFRKQTRESRPDLKLTLVTFFMKALVGGLKAMPRFNASLDKSGENLIMKRYFHIGVAVDTPNGLVVPVLRDVDKKSLGELATELEQVSERARARRLTAADLQGASITISSLGGIGGTAFTPIINPPEVAVLGVSRARWQPVHKDGAFVPRLLCPLSLSYDHRVIDGAAAARFTSRLADLLADIRQLLL